MRVYKALCLEDWHIQAENGDRQECVRGKTYTISPPWGDGTVTVFSQFWVRAPARIFDRRAKDRGLSRPSEEVYRKAERYHWLRGATSEWSALFSEPPKWDGGALVRLGSRWTGAKLDEVIDAQIGNEPQKGEGNG